MANFNFNKAIIGGRLTSDIEIKQTNASKTYTSFTVAVARMGAKNGEKVTDFINCVAFEKTADFLRGHFHKGSSICISGKIQTRSWTDAQGNKKYATDIIADEVYFVDSKNDSEPKMEELDDDEIDF